MKEQMIKIVINVCYGGFGLSTLAEAKLTELGSKTDFETISAKKFRTNPKLIAVVEELGTDANSSSANLRIIEIPTDINYHIVEHAGYEHIAENHRTWS